MFEFLTYKKRLQNVRTELGFIIESLEPIEPTSDAGKVATALTNLCRILMRVIDSLPG